jgi:ABC-type antimicrobial peptide transport system permease subunit
MNRQWQLKVPAGPHLFGKRGVDIALGFSPPFVAQALFWTLLVGAAFAMYPAYVAVRMNIVQAITSAR